jgi:putative acetyltransferase
MQKFFNSLNNIMHVEKLAFGQNEEAKLVANLLKDPTARPIVSLLAFHENEAVGYVLFTKGVIERNTDDPLVHFLAPLAVKSEFQKQGIGKQLIAEGLSILKGMGCELVFVLGHPTYYPRCGFINDAGKLGFDAPYPIPEIHKDAWMVQGLTSKGLDIAGGRIKCPEALDKKEYWQE